MTNLQNKLEALLFVSGDSVEISDIIEKWQVTEKELLDAFEALKQRFNDEFGIKILHFKNKFQLCSNPEYADDVSLVLNPIRERNLSKSTLETIAIIAYKQPVTRLDIEQIRGVNSDYAIQTLLKHNLIEVVGRKDAVGKPLLFGTTDEFLKRFDLENLNNLPNYDDLINSIQVINQTTLYNEFEIPDEETENSNEDKATNENVEEIVENEIKKTNEDDIKEISEEKISTNENVEENNKKVENMQSENNFEEKENSEKLDNKDNIVEETKESEEIY